MITGFDEVGSPPPIMLKSGMPSAEVPPDSRF